MAKEQIIIGDQEIVPGSYLKIEALSPISGPIEVGGEIQSIRGGGFYGKVMLFEDEVIKTTEPDAWHKLWRHINWGLAPFPPQSSETAAELDVLAGMIIHKSIPVFTNGKVITPNSIGYVDLGQIGYGQVIKKMTGRGALFDTETDENKVFRQTRQDLWSLGKALGLEQAAQVHPDNPFGKPNLWITDEGQMIWLDLLPAIKHTGWVWPSFYFDFHDDVREQIGDGEETFNKIHTDRFRQYIGDQPESIFAEDWEKLSSYLDLYDEKLAKFDLEMNRDKRTLVIEDAVNRGLITVDRGRELMESNTAYGGFLASSVIKPAFGAFVDFVGSTKFFRAFTDKQFQTDIRHFFYDPKSRRQKLVEHTILNGAREAHDLGLINDEQWERAWDALIQTSLSEGELKKLASTYVGLQAWYTISGQIINSVSIPLIASSVVADSPLVRLALGLFVDIVVPPVIRVASTLATSLMTRQELKTAIKVSAVPKLGGYLAIPADMARRSGNRSDIVWHYTKRGLIASLSKVLKPWGGWNSDLEAKIWDQLNVKTW